MKLLQREINKKHENNMDTNNKQIRKQASDCHHPHHQKYREVKEFWCQRAFNPGNQLASC